MKEFVLLLMPSVFGYCAIALLQSNGLINETVATYLAWTFIVINFVGPWLQLLFQKIGIFPEWVEEWKIALAPDTVLEQLGNELRANGWMILETFPGGLTAEFVHREPLTTVTTSGFYYRDSIDVHVYLYACTKGTKHRSKLRLEFKTCILPRIEGTHNFASIGNRIIAQTVESLLPIKLAGTNTGAESGSNAIAQGVTK